MRNIMIRFELTEIGYSPYKKIKDAFIVFLFGNTAGETAIIPLMHKGFYKFRTKCFWSHKNLTFIFIFQFTITYNFELDQFKAIITDFNSNL